MKTTPNPQYEGRSCNTCLYRATHEACDGCLSPPGWKGVPTVVGESTIGDKKEPIVQDSFAYANWKPGSLGEAMERDHQLEVAGARNIVIGGSGEAEVNAKWTIKEATKQLHYVSECCGYYTRGPFFEGEKAWLSIVGSWPGGERILVWESGVFSYIQKENGVRTWDRHADFIKVYLGKAYDCPGTPRALMAC